MTWVVQWLRLALSNWSNRHSVSLPSPEDGNKSGFGNVALEFRTMDKVQKPSNSAMVILVVKQPYVMPERKIAGLLKRSERRSLALHYRWIIFICLSVVHLVTQRRRSTENYCSILLKASHRETNPFSHWRGGLISKHNKWYRSEQKYGHGSNEA
jgi:hypothetical protein